MAAFRLTAGAVVHGLATLPRPASVAAFGVVAATMTFAATAARTVRATAGPPWLRGRTR